MLYSGWKEALALVLRHVCSSGPFHGICGFSQGGLLAALVCQALEEKQKEQAYVYMCMYVCTYSMYVCVYVYKRGTEEGGGGWGSTVRFVMLSTP